MRRNRQAKVMAIVALCVSVIALTIGFAAFSNTLTISSSATVSPDKSDFKLVVYGIEDISKLGDFDKTITSLTQSEPYSESLGGAKTAIINNDNLTISNLDVTFKEPYEDVIYYFKLKNEGKYDVYITRSDFEEIVRISANKTCTAAEGTTEQLVQQACEFISVTAHSMNYSNGDYFTSEYIDSSSEYMTIPVGSFSDFIIEFHYRGNKAVRADGDFYVDFDDIKINYSTVKPE